MTRPQRCSQPGNLFRASMGYAACRESAVCCPRVAGLGAAGVVVLRYMPTNLSAPEIARELSVSVTTIRTHIRHLFGKLGAHGRTEAVARARSLGLLAPSARAPEPA